jgi:hypothetical protein
MNVKFGLNVHPVENVVSHNRVYEDFKVYFQFLEVAVQRLGQNSLRV